MKASILQQKSYAFSIEIVKICRSLQDNREFILSRQLLKSGTSIAANIRESAFGQSRSDFISKLSIALKEAYETDYWIQLLGDTNYLKNVQSESLRKMLSEILALLISSIKTAKKHTGYLS